MEGYIVYGLWLLFLATIVFGIIKLLDLFVVDDNYEECPLGNDCAIETTKKKEMNKRVQSKIKGVSKKKIPGSDGVIHTDEYYDTERNR